jgi:hypothetical protein
MRRHLDLDHCANKQEAVIAAYVEELEENDRKPKGLGRQAWISRGGNRGKSPGNGVGRD